MLGEGFVRGNPPLAFFSIDTQTRGPFPPQGVSGAAVWPAAETAIYAPVMVRASTIVRKLWVACFSTGTGNFDIGLYDASGAALLRKGSTAHPAATGEYVWDCTDTFISPGIYYLALVSDNATDTFYRFSATAPLCAALGIYSQASAFPLPATATMAVDQTLAFLPVVGLLLGTVVS